MEDLTQETERQLNKLSETEGERQRETGGKSDRGSVHGFSLRKNELFRSMSRWWARLPMAKPASLNSPASPHRAYRRARDRESDFPLYAIN